MELYFSKIEQVYLDETPKLHNYIQDTIIIEKTGDEISSIKKELKNKFKNLAYIHIHEILDLNLT